MCMIGYEVYDRYLFVWDSPPYVRYPRLLLYKMALLLYDSMSFCSAALVQRKPLLLLYDNPQWGLSYTRRAAYEGLFYFPTQNQYYPDQPQAFEHIHCCKSIYIQSIIQTRREDYVCYHTQGGLIHKSVFFLDRNSVKINNQWYMQVIYM